MDELLKFIKEQIATNQFFQGGLILTLGASVLYYLKAIPGRLYAFVKKRILFRVWFDSRDSLFDMFHSWVHHQEFTKTKRDLRAFTNNQKDPPQIVTTLGYDTYFVRHDGIWLIITQQKDGDQKSGKGEAPSINAFMMETYSITCLYWNRRKVLDLLSTVVDTFAISKSDEIPIYNWNGYWSQQCSQNKKDLNKIILRRGLKESIVKDCKNFFASSDWYETMQVPYQRGYLFSGPAGTGKTTLAVCLASKYNMRLCILDISDVDSDTELKKAFTTTPGRSILLVEDFDSFFQGRKNTNMKSKVTFSGLLNAINGAISTPGRIIILTTNHVSKLDPALARVGRIDKRFHLDYVDMHQAASLVELYHPGIDRPSALKFGRACSDREISPADLSGHFETCRNEGRDVFDIQSLIEERDAKRDLSEKIYIEGQKELEEKEREESEEGKAIPEATEAVPTR